MKHKIYTQHKEPFLGNSGGNTEAEKSFFQTNRPLPPSFK